MRRRGYRDERRSAGALVLYLAAEARRRLVWFASLYLATRQHVSVIGVNHATRAELMGRDRGPGERMVLAASPAVQQRHQQPQAQRGRRERGG